MKYPLTEFISKSKIFCESSPSLSWRLLGFIQFSSQAPWNYDKLGAFRSIMDASLWVVSFNPTKFGLFLTLRSILCFLPKGSPPAQADCIWATSSRDQSDVNAHKRHNTIFHYGVYQPRCAQWPRNVMVVHPTVDRHEYVHGFMIATLSFLPLTY